MKGDNICCNIIWFILIGWHLGLSWCLLGLCWCLTIIGIPFGIQAIRIGIFAFWPIEREFVEKEDGFDSCDCCLNMIWIFCGGLLLALSSAIEGIILCITIIGIPCGMQLFKFAEIALFPFGRKFFGRTTGYKYHNY